jgi:hypothetical protein
MVQWWWKGRGSHRDSTIDVVSVLNFQTASVKTTSWWNEGVLDNFSGTVKLRCNQTNNLAATRELDGRISALIFP